MRPGGAPRFSNARDAAGERLAGHIDGVQAAVGLKRLRDEFTEGKTWEEWMETRYEEYSRPSAPNGNAPSFQEGLEMGFWRDPVEAVPFIALKDYVEDPEGRPRTTPSGKIELYSERLATIRDTWTFHNGERDVVRPVPSYFPEIEGVADVNETYPLLFSTWKAKNQFHSRYQVIEELQQASGVGSSILDRLRQVGALGDLPESSQVSFF